MTSPYLFRSIGERILRRVSNGNQRSFVALFGIRPLKIFQLWGLIVESGNVAKIAPRHLMWTLLFLRSYSREEVLATMVGVSEKTMRKWTWLVIENLATLDSLVSREVCVCCRCHSNIWFCYLYRYNGKIGLLVLTIFRTSALLVLMEQIFRSKNQGDQLIQDGTPTRSTVQQ
jgi:hypothetical protein